MVLAHELSAAAARSGGGILCTLILIGAVISSILVLLALIGIGPWARTNGAGYGANHFGPIVAAVVLWVLYFILC